MKSIQSLMSLLAFIISKEKLVEEIHSCCTNYLAATDDEVKEKEFNKISMWASTVLEKSIIGDSDSPENFINHLNKIDEIVNITKLVNPKTN